MEEEFIDEIDRDFVERGPGDPLPIRLAKTEQHARELNARNRTLLAETERLRGELAAEKAEDSRNRKDFRSAIDNWIATANDYMERWKEASVRAEAAEAQVIRLTLERDRGLAERLEKEAGDAKPQG